MIVWEYTAIALIILGGIPHGALDPILAKHARIYVTQYGFICFVGTYSSLATLIVFLWIEFPILGLSGFLLISAYHFGRDQKSQLQGIPYGILVLSLTVWFWPAEVEDIFRTLIFDADPTHIMNVIHFLGYFAIFCLLLSIKRWNSQFVFEIFLLFSLAAFFPPLIYFSFYFVFIHSIRHINYEFALLDPKARDEAIRTIVIYALITIVIGVLIFFWFYSSESFADLHLKVLFIGLAAITVPHMLLVEVLRILREKAILN